MSECRKYISWWNSTVPVRLGWWLLLVGPSAFVFPVLVVWAIGRFINQPHSAIGNFFGHGEAYPVAVGLLLAVWAELEIGQRTGAAIPQYVGASRGLVVAYTLVLSVLYAGMPSAWKTGQTDLVLCGPSCMAALVISFWAVWVADPHSRAKSPPKSSGTKRNKTSTNDKKVGVTA